MKLAAIYNVWDGDELLPYSIASILEYVDVIIIIWQEHSNYGEYYYPEVGQSNLNFDAFHRKIAGIAKKEKPVQLITSVKYIYQEYKPVSNSGASNETSKRNIGLDIAKEEECTHFLFMDCDESYQDFGKAKKEFIDSDADGSVCELFTYWVNPTYQLEPKEDYFVPFIHKLRKNTLAGMQEYPWWCDPTRRVNEQNVVKIASCMHHFSYVRNDIERKLRNSSAKINIEKSTYLEDYKDLKRTLAPSGHYIPCMKRNIKIVDNIFNIYI